MKGLVLTLLGLVLITNARKNFHTGNVPVGFDNFSLEENIDDSSEHRIRENMTQHAREIIAIEEPNHEIAQKEKEEQELARTIEWEQRKIQELREERERVKQQKKEEIERIMKEQAIEQARIEAARAQRKRMRVLEEQRRKLMEAKRERERQEKMLAELEIQKQEEIRKLEEEKEKQRQKLEEERKRLAEEEQRRKKLEEEQRKREEEEERKKWLEEERLRVAREQEEERRRIEKQQEEQRKKHEEEERKRITEQEEEEERRRHEEEEEERKMKEVEEKRRRRREEESRKRAEEAERHEQMQTKREQLEAELKEENRGNYKHSTKRRVSKEIEYNIAKRHQELLARFGSKAQPSRSRSQKHNRKGVVNEGSAGPQEELDRRYGSSSFYTENDFDGGNSIEQQNSEQERNQSVDIDFSTDQPVKRRRKSRRRKLRRRAHGIKSVSAMGEKRIEGKASMEKEGAASTFLGGWTDSVETDKHYIQISPTTTSMPRTLAVVVQPIPKRISSREETSYPAQNMLPNPQQIPNYQDQEQYLKAYYEQYYKEWYRQHNEANTETESPLSESSSSPMPRRQIKFQFGKSGDFAENTHSQTLPKTYSLPYQPSSFEPVGSVQQPTYVAPQIEAAPEATTSPPLTRAQLDKMCADIQKTTKSFGIKDPKTFALNNCSLIKMYYKQVTCEQINSVMDYCERGAFLAS